MMSQANSSFRSVATGVVVTCALLVLSGLRTIALAETAGDDWSVGAASADEASVGVAATVDVPPPGNAPASAVRHSTSDMPSARPRSAAPQPGTVPADTSATQNADYEDADPSALEVFRSDLDPYGRWVDDSRYGRVWVPDTSYVGSDFAPYVSNGHWALDSDDNWVWASDYPFGWVVFHYGRWVWIDNVGWSWVPGRRYAPAWVVWRVPTGDYAYVGWAPAPPTYVWFGTGVFWLSYYPPLPFVFCPSSYVFYPHFGAYLVRDHYFARTLVRHSVWYSTAPIYGRRYASPPIARARIPANAVPAQRVSANPRALALSRSAATPNVGPRGTAGLGAGRTSPSFRSNSTAGGYSDFTSRPRPMVERPSYGNRQVRSLGSVPGRSFTPSTRYATPRAAPSTSPRYSSPSTFSSPRYSAPSRSYSAPSRSYSAPSRSYSAPSRSYSAPSRSYSAPSYSAPRSFSSPSRSVSPSPSFSSGGGLRGGGGGFRTGGGGRHR